jgi:hypothetical protein
VKGRGAQPCPGKGHRKGSPVATEAGPPAAVCARQAAPLFFPPCAHACVLWLLLHVHRLRLHRIGIGIVIVSDGFMKGGAGTFHSIGALKIHMMSLRCS